MKLTNILNEVLNTYQVEADILSDRKVSITGILDQIRGLYKVTIVNNITPEEYPQKEKIEYTRVKMKFVTRTDPNADLFQFKDTVLCSDGDGRPNLVTLEENSVLSHTKNGITSQTLQDLLISNYEPLITQCDRFELTGKSSVLISNALRLKASRSRPDNPQPGTIVYNSRKKAFQGYDGKSWKTLKWED